VDSVPKCESNHYHR